MNWKKMFAYAALVVIGAFTGHSAMVVIGTQAVATVVAEQLENGGIR